jgi:hypothetical protein
MFTKQYWLGEQGALVRAVRTFAQSAAALITVNTFSPMDLGSWHNVIVVSGTAALVSLLMSLDRREAKTDSGYTSDPAAADYVPKFASGSCGAR